MNRSIHVAAVCASDVTDEQWSLLEPLLPHPDPAKGGRPRLYPLRQIVDALFFIEKTGCQWRMLPPHYPPWNLVWQHFRRWRDDGTWERVRLALNVRARQAAGKEPLPSAIIGDTQSVKTCLKGGTSVSMAASASRDANATC